MEAAAGGVEKAARCQETDRPKIDVLVAAERSGQRAPGLREGRWIQHDRIERYPLAFVLPEIVERVGLYERDVSSEFLAAFSAALTSAGPDVSRAITWVARL